MKKIVISIVLAIFILSVSGYFAYGKFAGAKRPTKPSEYRIGITYETALRTPDRPILAMFYADWCTYCLRFMPTLKKLAEKYDTKYNFVMIDAEAPENEELIKKFRISGFPTLYIIDPEIDNIVSIPISSYQSVDYMQEDMDRYLRVKKLFTCNKNAE